MRALFQLSPDKTVPKGAWDAKYSDTAITLAAHPDTHEIVKAERATSGEDGSVWAVQALFLPALVEALGEYLKQAESCEGEYLPEDPGFWATAIARRLRDCGIALEAGEFCFGGEARSVLWAAQRLLGDPLSSSPLNWRSESEGHADA